MSKMTTKDKNIGKAILEAYFKGGFIESADDLVASEKHIKSAYILITCILLSGIIIGVAIWRF